MPDDERLPDTSDARPETRMRGGPKKLIKPALLLMAILLAIIAGLLAWYSSLQLHRRYDATYLPPVQSEAKESLPEGFIAYTNEEFGFSFQYPKAWGRF